MTARGPRKPRRRAIDRYYQSSPQERWRDYLGDPTVADAILDRLAHRAHTLPLTGPSRRKANTRSKPATD